MGLFNRWWKTKDPKLATVTITVERIIDNVPEDHCSFCWYSDGGMGGYCDDRFCGCNEVTHNVREDSKENS